MEWCCAVRYWSAGGVGELKDRDDKTSSTMPRFRTRPSGLMNGRQTQLATSIGQTEINV